MAARRVRSARLVMGARCERPMRGIVCALALFFILGLSSAAAFAAEQVETVDTDKDGKPDEWRYSEGGVLVRIERDRDHNGTHEVRILIKEGKPEYSEVDRNGDGRPDLIRFYEGGKPQKEQADLNFDGKMDAWTYYKEGFKDLLIMDKNFDGKPDAWFYYAQVGLKLVGGRVDDNFDGKIDRSFGQVPKEETRQPW